MRHVFTCALPLLLTLAGCQTTHSSTDPTYCCSEQPDYSTTLLFNRDASLPTAGEWTQRSIWPGILSPTQPGESVLVRERFIDWQGPGMHGRDFTYRRFDAYRVGYERH